MTAPTVSQIDSITGAIDDGAQVRGSGSSQFGHPRTYTFKRRYSHYVTNTGQVPTITSRANFFGGTTNTAIQFDEGLFVIPYYNLGIAMNPREYNQLRAQGNQIRILEMGYEISNMTVLQENIVARTASTNIENVFQNRPALVIYEDDKHTFDEVVGYQTGTTAGTAFCRVFNEQTPIPTFTNDLNRFTALTADCTSPWPTTQASGTLKRSSFFVPAPTANAVSTSYPLVLEDVIPSKLLYEGKTHKHTWKNPRPVWHAIRTHGASNGSSGTANIWLPPSRGGALRTAYQGQSLTYMSDNSFIGTTVAQHPGGVAGADHVIISNPPIHYVKGMPIMGPDGILTIVYNLWIDYHITVEVTQEGEVPILGWTFGTTTTAPTNASVATPWCLGDIRHTFGENLAVTTLPTGEVETRPMPNPPKRRREQDEEMPNTVEN